jgi:esterase/lipase
MKYLIKTLEISAAKHGGETPLTIGHLLNICRVAEKMKKLDQNRIETEYKNLLREIDPMGQEGLS